MHINLRFFASVRESLGIAEEKIVLPEHVRSVGDVRELLRQRGGVWAEALAEGRVLRMAYNHQMTVPETPVTEGCEVAFFPPVTGG